MFTRGQRGRRIVLAVASVLVAVPFVGSSAVAGANEVSTQPSGSGSVTFGVQPADATGADGRPFFAWGGTPGATLTDHVAMVNYSPKPVKLSLYATDALNTDEGGFGLLATSDRPSDAGSWVHLIGVGNTVRVPGRAGGQPGSVVVPVEVKIPDNASPGDHSGGVVAVLTSIDPNNQGTKVKLEQRVGSRVFVRVAGEVDPQLAVQNLSTTYHGTWNPIGRGSATVTYTLKNTGNVNLAATSQVTVGGLLTDSSAGVPDVPLLLPGGSVDVSVEVPDVLPQFAMTTTVDVQGGSPASGTVDNPPTVAAQATFWAIPWPLIALLVLIVALGIAYYVRRRAKAAPNGRHAATADPRQPQGANS